MAVVNLPSLCIMVLCFPLSLCACIKLWFSFFIVRRSVTGSATGGALRSRRTSSANSGNSSGDDPNHLNAFETTTVNNMSSSSNGGSNHSSSRPPGGCVGLYKRYHMCNTQVGRVDLFISFYSILLIFLPLGSFLLSCLHDACAVLELIQPQVYFISSLLLGTLTTLVHWHLTSAAYGKVLQLCQYDSLPASLMCTEGEEKNRKNDGNLSHIPFEGFHLMHFSCPCSLRYHFITKPLNSLIIAHLNALFTVHKWEIIFS